MADIAGCPADIAARQEAVAEFASLLDLREQLSMAGSDVAAGVHETELISWAENRPRSDRRWHGGLPPR